MKTAQYEYNLKAPQYLTLFFLLNILKNEMKLMKFFILYVQTHQSACDVKVQIKSPKILEFRSQAACTFAEKE